MDNDKIQTLEGINNIQDLEKIILRILEYSNVTDVNANGPFISGQIKSALGNQTLLFYLSTDYLGRNYSEINALADSISKKLKGQTYNSIYIVSSKNITHGFQERLNKTFQNFRFDYWDREVIVEKIDTSYPDYWRHNDQNLLSYEKTLEAELLDDWSIKKIRQFKSAHEKLLKIFVEPRLQHKVNDFESQKKAFVKIGIEKLKDFNLPVILEGEPGIGKTRLLKQISIEFSKSNTNKRGNKYLPIFINNINLIETRKKADDLININDAIRLKIEKYFGETPIEALCKEYTIVLLIDSIDEFNKENQEKLFGDLKDLQKRNVKLFLGTRFQDYSSINGITHIGKCEEVYVEKFNDHQIKSFLSAYFKNDSSRANNLLESLKENSIIQRLPITPLNLSLISILYEENNFEIPATITDIYDNFNNLLLGRSLPDSRFEFFDINIRERILSAYALELLKRGERNYMTKNEFYEFFQNFFEPVKSTIKIELLPDALDFLIDNTGILVLQDNTYVKFMHESYMEYYASKEIFNYRREELEPELIENFLEVSWQYTAIFYAGRTKKMNDFLERLIKRTERAKKIVEYFKSIHGLGYISQALYMTDDNIRKNAVLSSLAYGIEIYEWMKKLGSDEKLFFKNLSMPLTAVVNSMYFFESYNSITIKGPLELAFDELLPRLEGTSSDGVKYIDSNVGYKLFTIALTLSSPRLGSIEKMKQLVLDTPILNDPLFEKLLEFGLTIAGSKDLYELKDDLKRPSKAKKSSDIIKYNKDAEDLYLTAPVGRLRFSQYDRIYPERKVLLITEGKTDAQIIEHAYIVLTGSMPYWEISPIHDSQGGAAELAKCLDNGSKLSTDKIVIGVFDNDDSGISQFNGTLKSKFDFYQNSKRIKKHKEAKVFGLKIPIPPDKSKYYQPEQKFNFFSIEHYFSEDLLKEKGMLLDTPIPEIYRINDKGSAKAEFSKYIRTLDSKDIFKDFTILFKEIDEICEMHNQEYDC